ARPRRARARARRVRRTSLPCVRPGDGVPAPGLQVTFGRPRSALDLGPCRDPGVKALALHIRSSVDAVLGRRLPIPDVLPEVVVIGMEDLAVILGDRQRT